MAKMRWGIAAPGNIARKFAAAAKNLPSDVELVAVASRSLERGRAFAAEYGIPTVFGSYEEMATSPLVDCVYVCPPHPFHKGCAEIFLRAKKHVLCEKPLCVNARHARELCALAKENGVFLMEAMWTRFLPAVNEAIALAKSGEIGEVLGLSADFCYALTPAAEPKIFRTDMAGGALLDVGVYTLHLAAMLFGTEPTSIKATGHVVNGCDRHTVVTLQYEGGAIASLSSATVIEKPEVAYIYGTKGSIRIPTFYGANEFYLVKGGTEERYAYPAIGDGFEEEILEASRIAAAGELESPLLPHARTVAVLEEMDDIRRIIGVSYPFDAE